MDNLISLKDVDIRDGNENERKKERDPHACACDECPICGGGKVSLPECRCLLERAMKIDDAQAVEALLHCATCWPENCLEPYVKDIYTESMARAFAAAVPDFFFDKGHGARALLMAAWNGREEAVRALLVAGVAADSSVPGTKAKALPMACLHGHALCVEVLLDHGADLNQLLTDNITPLHLAALGKQRECMEVLLRQGAKVEAANDKGLTPLHYAAGLNFEPCVKLLLEAGADPNALDGFGRSPLHCLQPFFFLILPRDYHWVQRHQSKDFVNFYKCAEELLKYGVDVNIVDIDGMCPLFSAVDEDDERFMELLLQHGANIFYKNRGENVLHRIARASGGKCLKVLRDRGLDVKALDVNALNEQGDTPLLIAMRHNEPVVKGLLEMGADASARDRKGYTALHFAVRSTRSIFIVYLVEYGADVNARTNDGKTPLHCCSSHSWTFHCMKELLKHGVELEARDNAGWNAMHIAASAGHMPMVKLLCKAGLSMMDRTADGQTPLHLVTSGRPVEDLIFMLRTFRASVNAQDNLGQTPLHVAAHINDEEKVCKLLLAGADSMVRNKEGKSPADVTTSEEVRNIISQWSIAG